MSILLLFIAICATLVASQQTCVIPCPTDWTCTISGFCIPPYGDNPTTYSWGENPSWITYIPEGNNTGFRTGRSSQSYVDFTLLNLEYLYDNGTSAVVMPLNRMDFSVDSTVQEPIWINYDSMVGEVAVTLSLRPSATYLPFRQTDDAAPTNYLLAHDTIAFWLTINSNPLVFQSVSGLTRARVTYAIAANDVNRNQYYAYSQRVLADGRQQDVLELFEMTCLHTAFLRALVTDNAGNTSVQNNVTVTTTAVQATGALIVQVVFPAFEAQVQWETSFTVQFKTNYSDLIAALICVVLGVIAIIGIILVYKLPACVKCLSPETAEPAEPL